MHYQHGQIGSPTNPSQKYSHDPRGQEKTSPALAKAYGDKYYGSKDPGQKKREDPLTMSNLNKSKSLHHKSSKDDKKSKNARKPKPVEEKVILWREA